MTRAFLSVRLLGILMLEISGYNFLYQVWAYGSEDYSLYDDDERGVQVRRSTGEVI